MIKSVFERRLQSNEKTEESTLRKGKSSGNIENMARTQDCEDDLYFEMEFPIVNRTGGETVDTSYHSDSYGSQSTLDSRDSPYRDDSSRDRESSHGRDSLSLRESSQGSRERPTSLRIPGIPGKDDDFHGDNAYCSLPRNKVAKIPRIRLHNYSVPATPADNWIKDYLEDTDVSASSSFAEYGPQSLSSSRSKSRLSLNLGDSRSSSPNKSRSISRMLRSSFSRLWGGTKDKARTPEPVSELEPLSLTGPASTKSSPRPESYSTWGRTNSHSNIDSRGGKFNSQGAGLEQRGSRSGSSMEQRGSSMDLKWNRLNLEDKGADLQTGCSRGGSPVNSMTEEIVQQSLAKGLPIIPFAYSSSSLMRERRSERSRNNLYNQASPRLLEDEETDDGGSPRSLNHLGSPRSPRSLHQLGSSPRRSIQHPETWRTSCGGRQTTSAPASRKTSRKETRLLDYIYQHDTDTVPDSAIPDLRLESRLREESEESCQREPQCDHQDHHHHDEDHHQEHLQEDRSLNSLLMRAKLELEQEMQRRKMAQAERLRGYAANNSRALERRRSSDNMYVMMSLNDADDMTTTDSAQEATEDYDLDDVFEKSSDDAASTDSPVVSRRRRRGPAAAAVECEEGAQARTNSPALCGSLEKNARILDNIRLTKVVSSSPGTTNNNEIHFPNSNICIRVEVLDEEGEEGVTPSFSCASGSPESSWMSRSMSGSPRKSPGKSPGKSPDALNGTDYLPMDLGPKFNKKI